MKMRALQTFLFLFLLHQVSCDSVSKDRICRNVSASEKASETKLETVRDIHVLSVFLESSYRNVFVFFHLFLLCMLHIVYIHIVFWHVIYYRYASNI